MHGPSTLWVDIAVSAVVIVSTVIAVLRGFVREVLSILGWAAAAVAAVWFGPSATAFLRPHISTPFVAPVLAYAGVFLGVLIPLAFASHWVSRAVHRSAVGIVDRCLGVPFGIARGLFIVGLVYLAVSLVIPFSEQPAWITHAKLLPVVRASSDVISSLFPDFAASRLGEPIRAEFEPAARHDGQRIYRASDRRALDRLIANTSASESRRQ
jgi:membrane protein required for colicin V production